MNPNLDPVEDIKRLGGERAELVMGVVDVLKPLVETGSPDMEDVAEMVEGLFEVCSGGEAKHNSRIVEMMAVKGLALAGVKKGHAIEKAVRQAVKKIGSPASKFGSFGDFYDAIVPVIHGDVSEEEMMALFESLGIDKLTVAQALLPALFRKSLALAGIAAGTIATTGERFDKAVGSWAEDTFEDAKAAIADCLDGDITQEDLEGLLALAGITKVEAACMAAVHMLRPALVLVLGPESKEVVVRVMNKVKHVLGAIDAADPVFLDDMKRLCMECTSDETRWVYYPVPLFRQPSSEHTTRRVSAAPSMLSTHCNCPALLPAGRPPYLTSSILWVSRSRVWPRVLSGRSSTLRCCTPASTAARIWQCRRPVESRRC